MKLHNWNELVKEKLSPEQIEKDEEWVTQELLKIKQQSNDTEIQKIEDADIS